MMRFPKMRPTENCHHFMSASEEAADSFAHLRHLKTAPHLCCQSSVEISQTETETGVAVGADIWLGDAPWWHKRHM
jgi:hypothetical protein